MTMMLASVPHSKPDRLVRREPKAGEGTPLDGLAPSEIFRFPNSATVHFPHGAGKLLLYGGHVVNTEYLFILRTA